MIRVELNGDIFFYKCLGLVIAMTIPSSAFFWKQVRRIDKGGGFVSIS